MALARAAASEHGQLLWTRGDIVRTQSERSEGSVFVFKVAQKKYGSITTVSKQGRDGCAFLGT